MAIELKSTDVFKKSIDAVAVFIKEGNLRFSSDGLYFKATDPSQIVLVDYVLDKKSFEKYSVEPNLVGIDLEELSKVMARSLPDDKLLMDLTEAELVVTFESDLSRTFKLPLLEVSEQDIKMPNIEY
ncbi:MAG: DNA polymerase sliding clamp, partial [Candidatus Diapherotrites archaeon]|nr:DNA polymerase sliding clamp [Candidatus Diapherotrites archaeon]